MVELILTPAVILLIVGAYFLLLMLVAWRTSRGASNQDFFVANKQSPWYIVAFGMIGASLSGVTFISVPGMVGAVELLGKSAPVPNMQFSYMQMVLGYLLGYAFIAMVLMPLYYRLNLTSIYTYLEQRFGAFSYKTGAAFFLLSRTIGASFRLYLVAMVLQLFVFDTWGIPFWATTFGTILLIWIYTFRGGIKTIIWTDTLQTTFMLLAVGMTVYELSSLMGGSLAAAWNNVHETGLSQIFFFEGGWSDPNNFFKQFLAGAFIAIVMTGLDQDMMQKNLSCKNIGEAQKNMLTFSLVLVVVNFVFLFMGALLTMFALQEGIVVDGGDKLYPIIAIQHLSPMVGILFIIGLIAAAYSSADSALTSLTTSFCVDFLGFGKISSDKQETSAVDATTVDTILDDLAQDKKEVVDVKSQNTRYAVHIGFSILLWIVIVAFWMINDRSVINSLFKFAGFTYGPLLGLYSFGLFSKLEVKDKWVPYICLLAPVLTYILNLYSEQLFFGYKFGFELLLLNGFLTFVGLFLIRDKQAGSTMT